MFQFIQKNKVVIQILMTLMFIPFAFSGVTGALRDQTGTDTVAKIGSYQITQKMFNTEFQAYKELRNQELGDQYNEAEFDSFESRQAYLNQMVDKALLKEAATQEHLSVSDGILQQSILAKAPKDAQGKVDLVKYEEMIRAQGLSLVQFEANIRAMLSASVIEETARFGNSILPNQQDLLHKIFSKVQTIEQKNMDPTPFLASVSVSSEQVKQYYQEHTVEFTRPAAFDLEYSVIPVLPANYAPSDDEIKAAFGGSATAADIASVRQDPVKLQQASEKAALGKMEAVAKKIIDASTAAPKDLKAIVTQFSGTTETAQNVTRKGRANLPAPLMSPDVRESLTTSEMAATNTLSTPVAYGTNLVVGRVIKSNSAGLQPLEVVQAEIENLLKQKAVIAKMREQADKDVASMNPNTSIGPKGLAGILLKHTISSNALAQVMAVKEYPKFVVSQNDLGVSIVRVVASAPSIPAERVELINKQISDWQGIATVLQRNAFLQSLREHYNVELYPERLGGADNPAAKANV